MRIVKDERERWLPPVSTDYPMPEGEAPPAVSAKMRPVLFYVKLRAALKASGRCLKENAFANWTLKFDEQCWMPILYFHQEIC